ncbi:MAG: four helix bundle protein [Saprospirales bacterium]|nr:four helix bundle protein [Saprospirales bacterium]
METEISFLLEEPNGYYSSGKSFEKLKAWQCAHEFTLKVYRLTGKFPTEEKFGLTNQFRRAAVSIAANISEGTGKSSIKEIIRFLVISRGSIEECQYYLILAKDLQFISTEEFHQLRDDLNQIGRLLNGLINSLNKKNS